MLPPEAVAPLILENVRDAVFAADLSNRITFWAPSAERLFGIGASEAHGRPFGELLPFDIAASSGEDDLLTALAAGRAWRGEGSVRLRDGTELWIESTVSPLVVDGRVVGGVSVSRDMTSHRAETRGRESAERALRALSTLNRALVRASDEATLLGEACRVAVDTAGHRFAWVAYAEDDPERTVRPVASAGYDGGLLGAARITWADEPRGRGPVGTAIRTGRTETMREPGDPRVEPWRNELGRAGFLSCAALPLASDERTFGALVVCAAERDAFSAAELDLLVEMAGDLAYGIVARRTQAAHDRAVDAMRRSEERYRTVVDALAEGVVVQDATGTIVAANPAARAILGWKTRSGSVPARWPENVVREDGTPFAPRDHPAAWTLRTGRARRNVLMGLRRPSGEVRWIAIHTDPLPSGDGSPSVVSSFEDVTHYRAARAEQVFEARLRAALSEAVQGIPMDAGLAESARTICDQVATLPGIDLVGVGAFLGDEELLVLASHAPLGALPRAGRTLPATAARYLRRRTAEGPWAQYVRNLSDAGTWATELGELGIVGIAVGPITHGEHVDGVLLIGSREREPARILVEKMPAVVAFSATSSALLAAQLHAHREEMARRRRIEQVLADAAFHPVFQPIVDLVTRDAVGYEALTRFDSGQRPDLCFRDAWSAGLGPGARGGDPAGGGRRGRRPAGRPVARPQPLAAPAASSRTASRRS